MSTSEPKYQSYLKVGSSTLDSTVEIVVSAEADTKAECIEIYDHVYETIKNNLKFEFTKKKINEAE